MNYKYLSYSFILAGIMIFMAGCKEKVLEDLPPRHRTYLHFVNLNPNYSGVTLNLESFETREDLFQNVGFGGRFPVDGYASLLTLLDTDSTSLIKYTLLNSATGDTIIRQTPLTLFNDRASTLILIRSADNDSTPIMVKTLDQIPAPTDSTGNIRLMNFSPDVISASLNTQDGKDSIENISFLSYTGFRTFRKGKRTLKIYDNTGPYLLDSLPNFEILQNRNYAFYIYKEPSTGVDKVLWEKVNK